MFIKLKDLVQISHFSRKELNNISVELYESIASRPKGFQYSN